MSKDRFKFRFYDKHCKMYLPDGHYINGDKWMDDYYESVYDLPEYIVPEQCTGLKDKNGNLIYEGDIIKDDWGRKYQAQWNKTQWLFTGNMVDFYPHILNILYTPTGSCEIIGNIHEQAEHKE